ncbi:hypothetical protein [Solicola sp. PLA-1-18]|uniref:hypothetical protein n=1 Tax=Solicola sp. PLA-1-18 TaxID=3380532 RepID=UPI003B817912
MTARRRPVACLLVAAAALSLAACTGGQDGQDGPAAAPTSSVPTNISPTLAPTPDFRGDPRGVIADVEVDSCDTDPGTVVAKGSVTNSASKPRDIAVVISWAVPGSGDVLARAAATLRDVPPGSTEVWSVRTTLTANAEVSCVTSAQRGTLSS